MLAHVHIMKTAGQTVCDILRQSLGSRHCDLRCGEIATAADVDFARNFYPHLASIAGHSVRPNSQLQEIRDIRFFSFLRDPVKRCVSHFQFLCDRNNMQLELLPWLERSGNYQTRFLCGENDSQTAINLLEERQMFVGTIEDFHASLVMWRRWSGFQLDLTYASRNVSRNNSMAREILSRPELVRAIREHNQADIELYAYVTETLMPRQRLEFGATLSEEIRHFESELPRTHSNRWDTTWSVAKRNCLYKPSVLLRKWISTAHPPNA